ncbi:MAG: ISL3 family transposase [Thermoanaerobaculales bacterium]
MRATTLLRRLVGVTDLFVCSVRLEGEALLVEVRPRHRKPRCGRCGRRAPGYDRAPERRWRHLGLGSIRLYLCYAPRRVECAACGVRTEQVSWAEAASRFTKDFEEMVAYLTRATDKTQVSRLMAVSWRTVGEVVERVVGRKQDPGRLSNLRWIGIDEFSHRKGQRYITLVVDHEKRRVVWAAEGKDSATLRKFFEELGPEAGAGIEGVTTDLAGWNLKAIEEHIPQAEVVFDRFHVQKLASDALEKVRREQLRGARGTPQGKFIFRSRYALLKNYGDLSKSQKQKLSEIERANKPLFRAYMLKETLAAALDYRQPKRAEAALREWLAWASRSRLPHFVKVGRTIRKHFDGILAYIKGRMSNGLVEGINNRMRMVARRAFGFHGADALIALLFLCCGGIQLAPRLP